MAEKVKRGSHNIRWEEIAEAVVERIKERWLPTPENVQAFIAEMRFRYEHGVSDIDIFDRDLRTLERAPPGWLLSKVRPLPWPVVADDHFNVVRGVSKLIHVGQDTTLINFVVQGWRIEGGVWKDANETWDDFERHVEDLKRLQGSGHTGERMLFRLIFTGWHRSALVAIERGNYSSSWTEERLVLVLVRQLLILCAFDLQRVAYYLRECAQEPLPGLFDRVEGEFGYVRASAVRSAFLTSVEDRRTAFDKFRSFNEADLDEMIVPPVPKRRGAPSSDPKKERPKLRMWPIVAAGLDGMTKGQVAAIGQALNQMIPTLQEAISQSEGKFIDAIKEDRELESMLAHYRLSGLEPMECLMITVLRFVQAEAFYMRSYEEYVKSRRQPGARPLSLLFAEGRVEPGKLSRRSPASVGLPAFCPDEISLGRAITLCGEYRRVIVKNAGRSGKDREAAVDPVDRDFAAAMVTAKDFLGMMGERHWSDSKCPEGSERRTFYLLDVFPDMRLGLWPLAKSLP